MTDAERETLTAVFSDWRKEVDHADDVAANHMEGHEHYALESYLSVLANLALEDFAIRHGLDLSRKDGK